LHKGFENNIHRRRHSGTAQPGTENGDGKRMIEPKKPELLRTTISHPNLWIPGLAAAIPE
jgi:hypothetical protein